MKRIKSPIEQAMITNNVTYLDILARLRMLSTSIFTWKNLDDLCGFGASRFLEQNLYDFGRACVVRDKELGCLALRANPSDTYNVYELPTRVEAYSIGYNKQYDFDEVAYIMNNTLERPTAPTTQLFAYRIYETERTSDVNINAQKTPVLIEGDTKTIMTLKQVYEQYSGNTPFIYGNKNYDLQNHLSVLNTQAPYIVDDLQKHKKDLLSEYLNFIGVSSFFSEKRERLVGEEAKGNQEVSNFYLKVFYEPRKLGAEKINELFKPKKKVEVIIDLRSIEELKATIEEILEQKELKNSIIDNETRVENGEIHDDNQALKRQ